MSKQNDSSPNKNGTVVNNDRRVFVKTVAAGVTSVTFAQPSMGAGEDSLPAIVSLLVDDELPLDTVLRYDPTPDNRIQRVKIPSQATHMQIATYGAGGAGSSPNSINLTGGNGGAGGGAVGYVAKTDLGSDELILHIGEGGTAGEGYETSAGGAFGGGAGGTTQFNGSSNLAPTFGGGGGGYTAIYSGESVIAVAGGGGGAGGVGSSAEADPGGGGNALSAHNPNRFGHDAVGPHAGEGGQLDEGGRAPNSPSEEDGQGGLSFAGGAGGSSSSSDIIEAGGAGGGGGGGFAFATEPSTGGGGGGGASVAPPCTHGGSGGGGAGGASDLATIVGGEPSTTELGAAGGQGGSFPENPRAESGADGWVEIEFNRIEID